MIGNLIEISLFTLAYFTMLTTIHESKNYLLWIQKQIIFTFLNFCCIKDFLNLNSNFVLLLCALLSSPVECGAHP